VVDMESSSKWALEFVEAMEDLQLEDSTTVVAFRIIPTCSSTACAFFSKAGIIGIDGIKTLLSTENLIEKNTDQILELLTLNQEEKDSLLLQSSNGVSHQEVLSQRPLKNFITCNGRVYHDDASSISREDLELLMQMESSRSKAMTRLLQPHLDFSSSNYVDSIAQSCTFLAHGKNTATVSPRHDLVSDIMELEKEMGMETNPFRFSWNEEQEEQQQGESLKIQISAVVDPVTEAAQRVAPLLLVFRDHFQLPLRLVMAPKPLLQDEDVPITSYYRFVASGGDENPKATFSNLPTNHVLTVRMDTPEPWNIIRTKSLQDADNLRCDVKNGKCGDNDTDDETISIHERQHSTRIEYGLENLLFFGRCYDSTKQSPPNGLQLTLTKRLKDNVISTTIETEEVEINADGSVQIKEPSVDLPPTDYSDTLVMKNVGYWQLRANPGVWNLNIAPGSRGAEIFNMLEGTDISETTNVIANGTKTLVMSNFVHSGEFLLVKRRRGLERESLFYDNSSVENAKDDQEEVINVFSLATGHLYERLLKIMMLSVTKRTSTKVKFWLFANLLSPTFKETATAMAKRIGCEVEFVTYKWPEWLRGQREQQRIIWGYKILFLDVLFPLHVKKIIYVDADQVVRGDLKELWDMDLQGAPYGYTPFCSSRESTLGFQFWRGGFWESHLAGKPYHISALYVVDLEKFRRDLVGDKLRSIYQQLSADPNSLANLDQDLPNYAQHQVPIFSLPQEWLWCESWCSDESKAAAKTIDLCNNPLHKENKVSMAKRIISGPLFKESWVELDAEVERYEKEYFASQGT